MRILFAWEIGQNIGGVSRLADIALSLAGKRGKKDKIELFFALQDPGALHSLQDDVRCTILQAPFYVSGNPPQRTPLTYADTLLTHGYDDPNILAATVQGWRQIYDQVKPAIVVAYAAPTALLATRGLPIKRIALGTGFDVPPMAYPMPPFFQAENIDTGVLARNEAGIVETINTALNALGIQNIEAFCEILQTDENIFTIFEELDHYPTRPERQHTYDRYVGPFFNLDTGRDMSWRRGSTTHVLAYLRPDAPSFEPCLEALAGLPEDHDCIVSAPGIAEDIMRPNLRVVGEPVRLDRLLKSCDLGISHAANAICSAFLVAGVPQLLLPSNIEQLMFARALGRTGAARGLAGELHIPQVRELIGVLLREKQYKKAAGDFTKAYKSFTPDKLAMSIADKIVKLIK